MIKGLPEPDEANSGEAMLAPGQFVEIQGVTWQFVRRSKDGFDQFYNRALDKTVPLHFSQWGPAWERCEVKVLGRTDTPPKRSVLRNAQIPLKYYSAEQQRRMRIREHYVTRFHKDFLEGKVTRDRDSVGEWLETVEAPPDAKEPHEHLSKYQVVRAYDDWISGGQRIEALAHGNAFGTHKSTLEDVRGIMEDVIEQFHVPYPDLEVEDLRSLIIGQIEKAQEEGEVPKDKKYEPCKQTIYNYIDRLNGHEKRRIREGLDEANREHAPRGRKLRPERPFDEWQADHVLLPVKIKVVIRDKQGNAEEVVMGSVWCTGVIDVATQYMLALIFGVDGPSTPRCLEALRFAMCPKGDFFRSIEGLSSRYDPTIIPMMIFVDNGLDLHGEDLDAMMADLHIENGFAGTYRGDHKESIERFNRRIKEFWRKFPGAVPRPAGRGKRPRKHDVVPLTIEQVRDISWRFAMEYNTAPQKSLGNISPLEAMKRGIAKIEAAKKSGKPLPLRSIMTKSVDEIDRIFAIREEATVTHNGVRHKHLEWSGSGFADRIGHKVEIHINPRDVGEVWVFDLADKTWFKALGVWPFYMKGLPYGEHLRITARLLSHEAAIRTDDSEKRRALDFKRYMADRAQLLRQLFALAGKNFALDRGKKRNEKLWHGSRTIGHSVDFAVLSTCAAAVDLREGRIPPGWEKLIDLKKGADGVFDVVSLEAPRSDAPEGPKDANDDDEIDMMSDPLLRNGEDENT